MAKNEIHNAIQHVINDDKPTVRKSIIIGVGGSGMKGILAAKKWIENNLPNEAYRYMRWVGIDTTDIETSIEGKGGRYRFPSDQFFQEEKRMLYISAPTPAELSLEFLREKYKNDPVFDWLPNPDVYDISTRAGQGANQTRPLGRLAFYYNEQKIRDALLKERDRLRELPDDPKFFQMMDVKEGDEKREDWVSFKIEEGKNRYYFRDVLPADNAILALEPDAFTRSILFPHVEGKIKIDQFPADNKGAFFEITASSMTKGKEFKFLVKHVPRGGQISIFITCSIVGGTGNGMILDLIAQVKDVFKDYFPAPRVYCILVLPSAFKRVVSNQNARANAYAALKEINYYMSGNTFSATYPSGNSVTVPDRLLDDGMLYLLDVENMSHNSLQGRDQVQELTGQFIATFVASTVGGAIEERMVNDSTRASIYLPADESGKRKAAFNSFGISRVIYPVPQLTELGYKITAVKMVGAFLKPVDNKLLLETIGDINRGLVRSLRLDCRMIFERMYPDYKLDVEVEFKTYRLKLTKELEKNDKRSLMVNLENLMRDYSKEEMEKIKTALILRMEKRYTIELDKIKTVLLNQIHGDLKDPMKGFYFSEAMLGLLLEKLELYQKKYYQSRVALARYSQKDLENILESLENAANIDPKAVDAMLFMISFNFQQLVFESMLQAAETFTRDFKALVFKLRNDEVVLLRDKVIGVQKEFEENIKATKFTLLEQKNPLYFYLINDQEIDRFLEKYFYTRLSVEDLCNEVNFVAMDRDDDAMQILESQLISTMGLAVLEKSGNEITELIKATFPALIGKTGAEVRKALNEQNEQNENQSEEGYKLSESSVLRIDIENIKRRIYKIIHTRFAGFNFENISIKEILEEKKIPIQKLLEKLDTYSRPYIYINPDGLRTVEYYRTITNFALNAYEEGDDPATMAPNDLPQRLNHYKKRDSAEPVISVENFIVANYCKPYEMISIGILLGFPIYAITSLEESMSDYHALMSERSHPLHLFNNPKNDARYFPDPFRNVSYINPAHLFTGLVVFKILEKNDQGYHYAEYISDRLKDMEAREGYKKIVLDFEKKAIAKGGIDKMTGDLIIEALMALAMLSKNNAGQYQFRREYSLVIRDILDGDGTGERAKNAKMSKDEYIEKFIQAPKFDTIEAIGLFLDDQPDVRQFLQNSIHGAIEKTKASVTSGAHVDLPSWKKDKVVLPTFKDKFEFFDYFEKKGSLEWQNFLKDEIFRKLNHVTTSAKFRLESDPSLIDRTKVGEFLETLEGKVPDIVLWEVKVENKLIK